MKITYIGRTRVIALTVVAAAACFLAQSDRALGQISDIEQFVDQCPVSDPAVPQILNDFTIRHNGAVVQFAPCTKRVSEMSPSEWTDELIALQVLRAAYYLDRQGRVALPWTPLRLYDWLKSLIGGVDIRDDAQYAGCCTLYDGRYYISLPRKNSLNLDYCRTWAGIAGGVALYGHEVRHLEGFGHESCCGIPGGCDSIFDIANLPSYGIQWWLYRSWLTGEMDLGFACINPNRRWIIANDLVYTTNLYIDRFCVNAPEEVVMPYAPGGECLTPVFPDEDPTQSQIQPEIALYQNRPNPFNAGTTVSYTLAEESAAQLEVFDILGRPVIVLIDAVQSAGAHEIGWDGRNADGQPVSSGVYFYRLRAGSFAESKKMLILK